MTEDRELMQLAYRLFPAPEDAFGSLLRRRNRIETRKRVVSVLVTAVVLAAAVGAAVRLIGSAERRVPGDGPPAVPEFSILPEVPAGLHVLPDLRSQVVVASGSFNGIPWSLRTNADASCVAFVREDVTRGGLGTDTWGWIGPGGATESCRLDRLGPFVAAGSGKTDGPLGSVLFGVVPPGVERLEVAIDGFGPASSEVLPAPDALDTDVRYFVAASGPGVQHGLVGSVSAIGVDGQPLATYRFPSDADRPGGLSAPLQTLWSVRWSGAWGVGIWRNGVGDWCFGELGMPEGYWAGYGWLPRRGPGCTSRGHLFDGLREGDIAIADAVVLESRGSIYQAWGTVSEEVAAVLVEFSGGRTVSVTLQAAGGFPGMGKVFTFARRVNPADGFGGRVVALDDAGDVIATIPLPELTPVEDWVSTWSPET